MEKKNVIDNDNNTHDDTLAVKVGSGMDVGAVTATATVTITVAQHDSLANASQPVVHYRKVQEMPSSSDYKDRHGFPVTRGVHHLNR